MNERERGRKTAPARSAGGGASSLWQACEGAGLPPLCCGASIVQGDCRVLVGCALKIGLKIKPRSQVTRALESAILGIVRPLLMAGMAS